MASEFSRRRKSGTGEARKPWKQCVTMDEVLAFEAGRPETRTPSPLLNEVLAAMTEVKPLSVKPLGEHFGIDHKKLAGAIELLTGHDFVELHALWARHWVARLAEIHPDWTQDQLAQAVGYADRTALWHADHRDKRRAIYRKQKERRERYARMTPEEREADFRRAMEEHKRYMEQMKKLRESLGMK